MQKEKQNKQNKPGRERKERYIIVTHYFLKEWVSILGVGPVVLYQELLTYCHKGKYIAWPTINSLCKQMGIAKTTLLRYQNTLSRFGLVKNISRGKSTTGHYKNNVYQITPLENIPDHQDIRYQNDTYNGSKMKPDRYQNDTYIGSETIPMMVSKRYPNNNNLNNNNITTTKRENVVVNFKKLKEKGEEKMQAVREQLRGLDFKEEFIEQLLKDYSPRKIEEKLDLLMEKRNIQNPAGWLSAALKNDYQDLEQEGFDEEPVGGSEDLKCRGTMHRALNESEQIDLSPTENTDIPEQVSREKDLKAIKLIQDNISACISPIPWRGRVRLRGRESR